MDISKNNAIQNASWALPWRGIKVNLWVVCCLCAAVGLYALFPFYSWNQRMTVEVEVDGKTITGSSVSSVNWVKNDPISAINGPQWLSTVRGEAVIVDLGERGVLFALLGFGGSDNTADLETEILGNTIGLKRQKRDFSRAENNQGALIVPPQALPHAGDLHRH